MSAFDSISDGQGVIQIGELLLAFGLASLIGLERQLRHKSAGLRTQAIVGTTAALLLLVSKYGFMDVLEPGKIVLDPSRVAAQIVSGVGFLGAGLILTRRGAVRGLTTAAAVWETAAIGMAAGAGLWLLAMVVTALHFVVAYGFTAIVRRVPGNRQTAAQIEVVYVDGKGLLKNLLDVTTASGWYVSRLVPRDPPEKGDAAIVVDLRGSHDPTELVSSIGGIEGVRSVQLVSEDDLD